MNTHHGRFQNLYGSGRPLSLDEAYLNITSVVRDLSEASLLAQEIKRQIQDETDLTASAVISFNKFLAKLASDAQKPDGLMVIAREHAPALLDALSIDKFFGVGKVIAEKLREVGIENGADLKRLGEKRLRVLLGKHGSQLYRFGYGEDDRPVEPSRERKSVGKEVTFERDLVGWDHMEGVLAQLVGQVEHRLVELDLLGRTLTLKVRWSDFQLVTSSVSRTNGFQAAQEMLPVLSALLAGLHNGQQAVRLLEVSLSHLQSNALRDRGLHVAMPSLWDAVE